MRQKAVRLDHFPVVVVVAEVGDSLVNPKGTGFVQSNSQHSHRHIQLTVRLVMVGNEIEANLRREKKGKKLIDFVCTNDAQNNNPDHTAI